MKNPTFLYIFTFLAGLIGCKTNAPLSIEAIDKELNEQLLTGKGLNPSLFSTKQKFQYYQVGNFQNLKAADLLVKLDEFVAQNHILETSADLETLILFFYKKKSLGGYKSGEVYRAAEENPDGTLDGSNEDLLAKTIVTKQTGLDKRIYERVVYDKDKVVYSQRDTVSSK